MRSTLPTLLCSALLFATAHAISISKDTAWSFSDAVVVGTVESVSQVREFENVGSFSIMLYRATVRVTHIDGVRVERRRVTFYYASPPPDPILSSLSCPPFVELTVEKRFKIGGVLKEIQGVGRVLWIPTGDFTQPQQE